MLVQYTTLSSLSAAELQSLKSVVTSGVQLEGRQHFEFMGKTFSVSEILAAKRVWEQQSQAARSNQLNG